MKKISLAVIALAALCGGSAWAGSHGQVSYNDNIKPLMEQKCFACHGESSPSIEEFDADKKKYTSMMKGPRMTSYQDLVTFVNGDDAGAIMRRLDDGKYTPNGDPGNMYIYLGGSADERAKNLDLFKRWVGHWTLKRQADLTAEDLKLFKIMEKR